MTEEEIIIECNKCKKKTYVLISEGITSKGEHYPIGECKDKECGNC